MGGQGIERRDIVHFIGLASVASMFPGFRKWAFACSLGRLDVPLGPVEAEAYKPLFFSPEQFRLVDHLAEMVIPADETPGAKQAGVAEFIDFMVANHAPLTSRGEIRSSQEAIRVGNEIQGHFIAGLDWLNARSKSEFGNGFLDCTAEQQNSLLEELAYKAKYKPTTETGRYFYDLMREYTVVGYYTSRIGLESLGYPGLKMFWLTNPGCPHHDDPTHANLQEPGTLRPAALKIAEQGGSLCGGKNI